MNFTIRNYSFIVRLFLLFFAVCHFLIARVSSFSFHLNIIRQLHIFCIRIDKQVSAIELNHLDGGLLSTALIR